MDKFIRHKQICEDLNTIYINKNAAYGDSFGKTFQELGIISAVTRMQDKFNRIKALATGAENNVKDEQLEDTLMDLANYCILTLIELEEYNNEV
jgi:isopropylmalate/homocitrate/citramalate synthase